MQPHNLPFDFVGIQYDGACALLAEAAGVEQDSPEWAANFRRERLAHDELLREAEFFVLASLHYIYIWNFEAPDDGPPAVRLETVKMFAKALGRPARGLNVKEMTTAQFRETLGMWLQDLAEPSAAREHLERKAAWYTESGFLEAVMYMEVRQLELQRC